MTPDYESLSDIFNNFVGDTEDLMNEINNLLIRTINDIRANEYDHRQYDSKDMDEYAIEVLREFVGDLSNE